MSGSYQTGRNVVVAYRQRSGGAYGDPATSGTGATGFRPISGGITLTKGGIVSNENRRDGMRTRGRHGQRAVQGSYTAELSVGSFDALFEAAMRGTWSTALTVNAAAMSSATLAVAANTITASAGSWLTAGLRVGDVIRATAGLSAPNLNRNLRITGLTATVITVAEALTVQAGPISGWTIVRPKKLVQPSSPIARDFSFEEYEADIDQSERFDGIRVGGFSLELRPDNMVTCSFNLVGRDGAALDAANSPYFTNPSFSTALPLAVVEARLRLGTTDFVDLTGFTVNFDLGAQPVSVAGANVTPDVFTNLSTVTCEITALRQNLNQMQAFLAETPVALHLLMEATGTAPVDFFSLCMTNLTLAGATKSQLGQDGPRTQTIPLLVGVDEQGGAFDTTMLKLCTSAA